MPAAVGQLDLIAAGLADWPALAKFADRLSITGGGDEVVVTFGGRNLSIRVSGQAVVVGGDEIALSSDARETLGRVANRLAQRLTQMDG